jgi:hypothetical protein
VPTTANAAGTNSLTCVPSTEEENDVCFHTGLQRHHHVPNRWREEDGDVFGEEVRVQAAAARRGEGPL